MEQDQLAPACTKRVEVGVARVNQVRDALQLASVPGWIKAQGVICGISHSHIPDELVSHEEEESIAHRGRCGWRRGHPQSKRREGSERACQQRPTRKG